MPAIPMIAPEAAERRNDRLTNPRDQKDHRRCNAQEQIEHDRLGVAEQSIDPVAEHQQEDHVSSQVQEAAVEKRIGEKLIPVELARLAVEKRIGQAAGPEHEILP